MGPVKDMENEGSVGSFAQRSLSVAYQSNPIDSTIQLTSLMLTVEVCPLGHN